MTKAQAGTLVPFPAWESNPYLGMLTLAAEAAGWRVVGHKQMAGLQSEVTNLGIGDVVHIHWTSPVTAGARTTSEAGARRSEFRSLLTQLKANGVTLLWTVHNEIAHDATFPEAERGVARDLAELVDAVIQLHEFTAEFVADSFALPAHKLHTIAHSSYLGVYDDRRDDLLARESLGIAATGSTVGFVGQLRPYKGVDALFRAADIASGNGEDLTVLVAGKLAPNAAIEFNTSLPTRARCVMHTDFVAPGDLWRWFRASDVMAFPYRKVLNSGSIPLAATFGRPCIVPDDSALAREYAGEAWLCSYDTRDHPDEALAEAIIAMLGRRDEASASARMYAREHRPYEMARSYLALIQQTLLMNRGGAT